MGWCKTQSDSIKPDFQPVAYRIVPSALLFFMVLLASLSGCGKSDSGSSTSGQSSSALSAVQGDAIAGKALFDGGLCSGCHGKKGAGPQSTGRDSIDMQALQRTSADFSALSRYIELQMPDGSPVGCGATCAADTAAYLLTWLASNSVSSTASHQQSSSVAALSGAQVYETQCLSCHGDQGRGPTEILADNWTLNRLQEKIALTMPLGDAGACDAECATSVAHYILSWQSKLSCEQPEQLLPRRLRLLTPREYQLTVNEIFGLNRWDNTARNLPITETVRGYDNNVPEIQVSLAHVSQYWAAAEELANSVNVNGLLSCTGLDDDQCARQWVAQMGYKIFRRPLSSEEAQGYIELFANAPDLVIGKRLTLKALLMSPNFIYRSEMGELTATGDYQLTPHEVATLLSYTYWGTMPDQALLQAAENNALASAGQIRQQVIRLLADDRAKEQLGYFAKQWLETTAVRYITKDPFLFPTFNGSVSAAMDDELSVFLSNYFLSGTKAFADLFVTDTVYVNQVLAKFYGLSGVSSTNLVAAPAGDRRGGILNLGAVLAAHAKMDQTSPISRGVFVRERLLCQSFPAPPPNAGNVVPLDPTLSTRERFSAHTDNDGCRDCHEKIDPIGFAFERYDASGKYRETEGDNLAVDDSGSITGLQRMTDGDYWPFQGTQGLAQIIAQSGHAAACLADQYQTFVQGVDRADACGLHQLVGAWSGSSYNLRELWIESALAPSYIRRQGETTP